MLTRPRRRTVLIALLLALVVLAGKAWRDTMMAPVVYRTRIALADYPAGQPPVRLVLISDLHVAGPDMPPSRLAAIVAQINALEPDLVLVAGDFVSDKRVATRIYSTAESLAPLQGLEARLGVVAVPGNHDHWRGVDEVRDELEAVGVTVLQNSAVRLGPLVIGGVDDGFTGHANLPAMLASMAQWTGGEARVVLCHSPDVFPALPADVGLTLAGHTHCGQIGWPWGGSPAHMSRYGQRYACGRVDEGGRTIVTGGGLGTSVLPFRLFTRPEVWVVEVGGAAGSMAGTTRIQTLEALERGANHLSQLRPALSEGGFSGLADLAPGDGGAWLIGTTATQHYALYAYRHAFRAAAVMHGGQRLLVFHNGRYIGQYATELDPAGSVEVAGDTLVFRSAAGVELASTDFSPAPPQSLFTGENLVGFYQ